MKTIHYLATIGMLTLSACSEKKETSETPPPSDGAEFASVMVSTAPENPKTIYSVRKVAKPGDTLTVKGKVMGAEKVLVDSRAIMVLGDSEIITSCDQIPGDACNTPWDVCCDDPDTIKESTLTVQVVDKDGKLLKSGFRGVSGIKELSELVVTGVVSEGSNKDNLMLNA
ncbi:MAG: hypothetical protein AB8F34_07730, partial [Akkermansiaceae bacterium]